MLTARIRIQIVVAKTGASGDALSTAEIPKIPIIATTHLRFFTRRDMELALRRGGWVPERWGAPQFGRMGSVRRMAQRATGGRSDEWLAGQLYVIARPGRR